MRKKRLEKIVSVIIASDILDSTISVFCESTLKTKLCVEEQLLKSVNYLQGKQEIQQSDNITQNERNHIYEFVNLNMTGFQEFLSQKEQQYQEEIINGEKTIRELIKTIQEAEEKGEDS